MPDSPSFNDTGLNAELIVTLEGLGYEAPTPVQAETIPVLLKGRDLLAQAQTGTGKTAAFALPIIAQLDINLHQPQALIIAPTRELAIQVAEAFQSYAKHLSGFRVTPIYGGQEYNTQLRALKRGVHVIVGTPGRVMDHLRRGTLSVKGLKTLVLDEADEMLKMGFVEDVEWILDQIPNAHQTALFSATMPAAIQKIAKRYLKDATTIQVSPKKRTVDTIVQSYMRVSKKQKLDVLTRFLEVEDIQAAIIFVRTKTLSTELAEKVQARGYAAAALNGDMNQSSREKIIARFKKGSLDIVVATDVAARGIDVERVSHVINFDIPSDAESYIHRIGRTGRAGRKGKAILFVAEREERLFSDIKRTVGSPIQQIDPPSLKAIHEKRSKDLEEKIISRVSQVKKLTPYYKMVDKLTQEANIPAKEIAAALASLMQQAKPMPTHEIEAVEPESGQRSRRSDRSKKGGSSRRQSSGFKRGEPSGRGSSGRNKSKKSPDRSR
jgi:ATP-dependent RNA helicase DeaD